MFKVGDKVICVDSDPFVYLINGEIYTISDIKLTGNGIEVVLRELPHKGSWRDSRFILANSQPQGTVYNPIIGKPTGADYETSIAKVQEELIAMGAKLNYGKIRKCECGSHKVGSDKHSDWCELYVKEF